jgi:hypothetical protein
MPEYNPDDFKPVEFEECFKPLIEHFDRILSEPEVKTEWKPNRDIGYIFAPPFLGGIL